ncbi:hypothetical protein MPI44_004567 [Klebsiella oxytoca]|nr:hypothetical protein [Klebsiella oxytoca]
MTLRILSKNSPFRLLLGIAAILGLAILFIYLKPSQRDADIIEMKNLSLFQGDGVTNAQSEDSRIFQKEPIVIYGYNEEFKAPTRTMIMFNGHPLLLNGPLLKRHQEAGVDLVRMTDGRFFICIHQRNDDCWRVINGTAKLPSALFNEQ